jgi:hypothetical protein
MLMRDLLNIVNEGEHPQVAQLQQLMATAKEPWEAAQYKWRLENLKNSIDLGRGAPAGADGQLKPVVDARTWMKQNPSLVKELPSEALPPEMQKPGILDKIKGAFSDSTKMEAPSNDPEVERRMAEFGKNLAQQDAQDTAGDTKSKPMSYDDLVNTITNGGKLTGTVGPNINKDVPQDFKKKPYTGGSTTDIPTNHEAGPNAPRQPNPSMQGGQFKKAFESAELEQVLKIAGLK